MKKVKGQRNEVLVNFIYHLLLDRMSLGALEATVRIAEGVAKADCIVYSDKNLENYAEETAARLLVD